MPVYLETARLALREFSRDDVSTVHRLLDDPTLAENMLAIPYPYSDQDARDFINWTRSPILRGGTIPYAIVPKDSSCLKMQDTFVGYISLELNDIHHRAELAYWMGKDYRGTGYIPEAVSRIIDYGFENYALNRIFAFCFTTNTGSRRVLEKCGFQYEGVWRQDVVKPEGVKDVMCFGLLRSEWESGKFS